MSTRSTEKINITSTSIKASFIPKRVSKGLSLSISTSLKNIFPSVPHNIDFLRASILLGNMIISSSVHNLKAAILTWPSLSTPMNMTYWWGLTATQRVTPAGTFSKFLTLNKKKKWSSISLTSPKPICFTLKEWNHMSFELLKCNGLSKELRSNSKIKPSDILLTKMKPLFLNVWALHTSLKNKTKKCILLTPFHIPTHTCWIFSRKFKKNTSNSSRSITIMNQQEEFQYQCFPLQTSLSKLKSIIIFL